MVEQRLRHEEAELRVVERVQHAIDVVLIDTKGHRAIDVFYVAYEGRKLSPEMESRLRNKLLAAC